MFRKRMRTRTGCEACKNRHLKCDEGKPICNNCRRLELRCTWGTSNTITRSGADLVRGKLVMSSALGDIEFRLLPKYCSAGPLAPSLGPGYQPFRDQIQFDLTIQSSTSLRGLISSTANPDFRDTSFLITFALYHGWIRDSLASFSAHTLPAYGKHNLTRTDLGVILYQSAVSSLRHYMASAEAGTGTFEILTAMIFLGMSDSLGTGETTHAIVHFQAAATICKTLRFAAVKTNAQRMLYLIAVESWLYHLSTLCLFHEECDQIMQCIDWTVIDDCFDLSSLGGSLRTSPLLGGMTSVYKLIVQITWFARQNKPLSLRLQQKSAWSAVLDELQAQPREYFTLLSDDIAWLYFSKYTLHILALRIILEKIANYEITNCALAIRTYVGEAQRVLSSSPLQEGRNPALAWPLVIFLCAANEETTFNFFVDVIAEIAGNFDEGHTRRMNKVLDIVRAQRVQDCCGLDLLLRKRGFLVQQSKV